MIQDLLRQLVGGGDLSRDQMRSAIGEVMEGRVTAAQLGAFLTALRIKGETVEELTGAAEAMRARVTAIRVRVDRPVVDTCGTGGDGSGTFNISTGAALVAAAAGACVAKHGNRAVSSRSGSADVLEALGIRIDLPPEEAAIALGEHGFAFLFAQALHPAMRHAAAPRRELGMRTVFNLLGPLCNPAGARRQVLGVFTPDWVEPLAHVLLNLGTERALVVHAEDGLDEISLCADTQVAELSGGAVRTYRVSPESLGFERASPGALAGGDAHRNAEILEGIFRGEGGAARDVVVLNSATALYVADLAGDLREGAQLAAQALDDDRATTLIEALRGNRPPDAGGPDDAT